MPEVLRGLLSLLLIVVGATGWGLNARCKRECALGQWVSATSAGLILSSYGLFFLGYWNLSVLSLSSWFVLPLLWPGRFKESLKVLKYGGLELIESLLTHPAGRLFSVVYPVLVLCCLTPNTHYDAQTYHYAIPALYLKEGSLHWTWSSYFEGLIQATHMLFLSALGIGGEFAANLLGPLFLLLLAASLLASGCREVNGGAASLLILLGSPVVIFQSLGGLTDLPVSFFLFLALRELLMDSGKWMRCALWCGAAISCKPTAIVAAVCLLLAAPRLVGYPRGTTLKIFALALVMGVPWWLRNFLATGDPLSPLLSNWTLADWTWNPLGFVSRPAYAESSSLKQLAVEVRAWNSFRALQESVHPLCWFALFVPGRLRFLVWCSVAPVVLLGRADLRYALPFFLWWALHFTEWLGSRRRVTVLLWIGALPGFVSLAGIFWIRLPLLLRPQLQKEFLMERGPYSGYLYLSQYSREGERAFIVGRRGYRCPLPYQCADTLPKREWKVFSAPDALRQSAFDYYVLDLREPRVMLALVSLAIEDNPYRTWHSSELAQGPLRFTSPAVLHKRMLEAGLVTPESDVVLKVSSDNTRALRFFLRALWAADVLFADESVVVLARPRSAGKDEPADKSKRSRL